jgi:hypothetical protein
MSNQFRLKLAGSSKIHVMQTHKLSEPPVKHKNLHRDNWKEKEMLRLLVGVLLLPVVLIVYVHTRRNRNQADEATHQIKRSESRGARARGDGTATARRSARASESEARRAGASLSVGEAAVGAHEEKGTLCLPRWRWRPTRHPCLDTAAVGFHPCRRRSSRSRAETLGRKQRAGEWTLVDGHWHWRKWPRGVLVFCARAVWSRPCHDNSLVAFRMARPVAYHFLQLGHTEKFSL